MDVHAVFAGLGGARTAESLQSGLDFLAQVSEYTQVNPVGALPGEAAVSEGEAEQPQEFFVGQVRIVRNCSVVGEALERDDDVTAAQILQVHPFRAPRVGRPAPPPSWKQLAEPVLVTVPVVAVPACPARDCRLVPADHAVVVPALGDPVMPQGQEWVVPGSLNFPVPGTQPEYLLADRLAAAGNLAEDGAAVFPGPDEVSGACVADFLGTVLCQHGAIIWLATVPPRWCTPAPYVRGADVLLRERQHRRAGPEEVLLHLLQDRGQVGGDERLGVRGERLVHGRREGGGLITQG